MIMILIQVDKNIEHIICSVSSLTNAITLNEKATYKQLDNNIRKIFEITKLPPKSIWNWCKKLYDNYK